MLTFVQSLGGVLAEDAPAAETPNPVLPVWQEIVIGAEVEAVFEDHDDGKFPYTLVQWRVAS